MEDSSGLFDSFLHACAGGPKSHRKHVGEKGLFLSGLVGEHAGLVLVLHFNEAIFLEHLDGFSKGIAFGILATNKGSQIDDGNHCVTMDSKTVEHLSFDVFTDFLHILNGCTTRLVALVAGRILEEDVNLGLFLCGLVGEHADLVFVVHFDEAIFLEHLDSFSKGIAFGILVTNKGSQIDDGNHCVTMCSKTVEHLSLDVAANFLHSLNGDTTRLVALVAGRILEGDVNLNFLDNKRLEVGIMLEFSTHLVCDLAHLLSQFHRRVKCFLFGSERNPVLLNNFVGSSSLCRLFGASHGRWFGGGKVGLQGGNAFATEVIFVGTMAIFWQQMIFGKAIFNVLVWQMMWRMMWRLMWRCQLS